MKHVNENEDDDDDGYWLINHLGFYILMIDPNKYI